jgi:outer membrane protein W
MTQRISRILFFLFIAAGSIRLSAQSASSDIGVWVVASDLQETTIVDEGDEFTLDFDGDNGYGLSFNRFWTERFSTEFAAQTINSNLTVTTDLGGTPFTFDAGELHAEALTAMGQWHFNRAGRFSPYIGGGIARLSGDVEVNDGDPDTDDSADLQSEIGWAAQVGANIRLKESLFLTLDYKYIPWSAVAEGDSDDEALDLDPTMLSVGLKVRF